MLLAIISIACLFCQVWAGTNRIVGPEELLTTISDCVKLMSDGDTCSVFGGDDTTGQLRYHEENTIEIRNLLDGTKESKIIGFGKHKPLIDGTVVIPSDSLLWRQDTQNRWYTQTNHEIWQLFVDDDENIPQMQVVARWPDASWQKDANGRRSVFNNTNWSQYDSDKPNESQAGKKSNGFRGRLYDSHLEDVDVDLTGAVAIMNIGSWNTFNGKIEDHSPNQPWFEYEDHFDVEKEFGKLLKKGKHQYYIEGILGLLNSPEEWYIESCTKSCKGKQYTLYTFDDPRGKTIRGKVQTYVFDIERCNNLAIENFEFFATTMKASPADRRDAILDNLAFRSNYFHHASCSKRILGVASPPEGMVINAFTDNAIAETSGSLEFVNNVWFGCDGSPIVYGGKSVKFINNLFQENDWSNANAAVQSGGMATVRNIGYPSNCKKVIGTIDMSTRPAVIARDSIQGKGTCPLVEVFKRNTLIDNGSSAGLRPAITAEVTLNDVSGQCWGQIQNDGSGMQVKINAQPNTDTHHNWIHDSPKFALRFDCPNHQDPTKDLKLGEHGKAHHNVAWNTNGFLFKGYNHYIFHNLAFAKSSMWGTNSHCALCVPHYIGTINVPFNNGTQVDMNIADLADGMEDKNDLKEICNPRKGCRTVCNCAIMEMAGDSYISKNDVNHLTKSRPRINFARKTNANDQNDIEDIHSQLVDANCRDFRPIKSSKYHTTDGTAGPYDEEGVYWIPGRQEALPSQPVPTNKCNAKSTNRDTLMFLEPYDTERKISKYQVYMGINKMVIKSDTDLLPGDNIINISTFFPGETIQPADYVRWRVDTVWNIDGEITTSQGEEWTFNAI